ncbi:MAG: hypothetical protein KJN93_07190 [Alphaproteobacteria bacterium]|nr:hypothetical protein [Alphaproteobacteria bacterium]NNF24997.1 hypothetical protein [Paracoccaceae bacterium]
MADPGDLDPRLLAAHARGDEAALVALYTAAADIREAAGDTEAACFYLTHAYVFALHLGHPETARLHGRLVAYGREE